MMKLTVGEVLKLKQASTNPKRWYGEVPKTDSFGYPIRTRFIDGSTSGGWAIMTPANHKRYGRGLGLGRGQEYALHADGNWYKVNG